MFTEGTEAKHESRFQHLCSQVMVKIEIPAMNEFYCLITSGAKSRVTQLWCVSDDVQPFQPFLPRNCD